MIWFGTILMKVFPWPKGERGRQETGLSNIGKKGPAIQIKTYQIRRAVLIENFQNIFMYEKVF